MPKPAGVFVSAFLADRILAEADGVLSAIRMLDVVQVTGPKNFIISVESNLIVLFKSENPQQFTATLRGFHPDGSTFVMPQDFQITLTGGAHGVSLLMILKFDADKEGIYWMEVVVADEVVQWVPLQVKRISTEQGELPKPSAS